jgi:hypothetical protein
LGKFTSEDDDLVSLQRIARCPQGGVSCTLQVPHSSQPVPRIPQRVEEPEQSLQPATRVPPTFRRQKACVSVGRFKLRRRSSKAGLDDESEGEPVELACLRHGRGSHWLGALNKAKLLDWPRNGVGIIARWPGSDNQGAVCCNDLRCLGFNDFFRLENKDWLNIVDASHHHEFYEIIEASPRSLVGFFSVSAK